MTNKERYKQAFAPLHASGKISMEVNKMREDHKAFRRKSMATAACAALVILLGTASVSYAADLGGIREKLSIWIRGKQWYVTVSENEGMDNTESGAETDTGAAGNKVGSYKFTFADDEGATHEMSGGGVSIDANGDETPLSAQDVLDEMNHHADVEKDKEGVYWLYYLDRSIDITDLIGNTDTCKISLENQEEIIYLTLEKQADGSVSAGMTNVTPEHPEEYTDISDR